MKPKVLFKEINKIYKSLARWTKIKRENPDYYNQK